MICRIIQYIYVVLSLTIMTMALGLVGYWLYEPETHFTNMKSESTTNQTSYEPGDVMIVSRYLCMNKPVPQGRTIRHLINSAVHVMPDRPIVRTEIGCTEQKFQVEIPHGLTTGFYTYKVILEVKANPLKTIHYTLPPVQIFIRNPKEYK